MAHRYGTILAIALAVAVTDAASGQTAAVPELPRYEAANPGTSGGDRLSEPRRLAAAIVAQAGEPGRVVEVGSFTGEFLEAFMERFPRSRGQWTEPVATNRELARRRLARFGDRVDYVIGCPARDLGQGCVTGKADVLVSSWLSIHQNGDGIARFYRDAARIVPAGGWITIMDHVREPDAERRRLVAAARDLAVKDGIAARIEGPPVHHADWVVPTLDDQMAAMRAAGFAEPMVAWRRLDTVLIVARRK